ncbi:MAG: aminodeoxychorismate/anthranilate synthase component II [Candidatus Marinimicrobia bacterium]|nr:aminodeoxychorismate/anthranilate synthase component II [Candidatus Neomarinimicrobiota bacterium]MBL7023617.1 aminodeoxychorismate/anthranilate synthase component II [Candidatus Neomarinimicrobiota bacterium]MBL7109885.1 aminodeoxychorismate/anthranilate synthase component II [Candidatus Neomarinimicrobiota bacterium]
MILIIDNYDSFTYNLVQYIGSLKPSIMVVKNDKISIDEIRNISPEKIVISPGPGIPENAGISIDIVKEFASKIPIMGICLGHQAIVIAYGGNIINADEVVHGKTSRIIHFNSKLFEDIPKEFEATRYHSLVASESTFPDDLKITAKSTNEIIMACEHKIYPVYGVQFHPESILTEHGMKIIENFLNL